MMSCTAKVSLTTNISGAKWTKLVNSSMILSVFGMLGLQSWEATDIPEVFKLCIASVARRWRSAPRSVTRMEPIFGFTAEELMGSTDDDRREAAARRARAPRARARARRAAWFFRITRSGATPKSDYLTGVVVAERPGGGRAHACERGGRAHQSADPIGRAQTGAIEPYAGARRCSTRVVSREYRRVRK